MSKISISKIGLSLALISLLSACAGHKGDPFQTPHHQYLFSHTKQLSDRQRADLFEAILAADMAEHQQDYQSAISYYLYAADLSKEQQLIEKSIELAQETQDFLGVEQAALIWLTKDPLNDQALGVLLEAQLVQQNLPEALLTLNLLFAQISTSEQRYQLLEAHVVPQDPRVAIQFIRELSTQYPKEVAVPAAFVKFIMNLANTNKNPDNMLEQALSKVEEALKINPTFSPAVKLKSHALFQLRRDDEARSYLSALFNQHPNSTDINQLLGQLLYDLRDFTASAAHYTAWLTNHPDDLESRYYLAASEYALSQYYKSLNNFKQLLAKDYQTDTSAFYCADAALKTDKKDTAISCFQQVTAGRFLVPSRIQLAHLFAEQNKQKQALLALKINEPLDENEKIQLIVAEIDLLHKYIDTEQAKQKLKSALSDSPDNLALLLKKIEIYQLTSKPQELVALLNQAKLLIEDNAKLDRFNLAAAALINNNGHVQLAIDWLDSALVNKPNDKEILYAKALYKESLGLYHEMVKEFKHLLELYPDDLNIQNALGYTLADHGKELELAKTLIEQAFQGLPDNAAVIDSKGWLAYRLGDLSAATEHLTRAFRLAPSADVAAHLGEVLWQNNQQQQAREVWQKGWNLDNQNPILKKTLERFKFVP